MCTMQLQFVTIGQTVQIRLSKYGSVFLCSHINGAHVLSALTSNHYHMSSQTLEIKFWKVVILKKTLCIMQYVET